MPLMLKLTASTSGRPVFIARNSIVSIADIPASVSELSGETVAYEKRTIIRTESNEFSVLESSAQIIETGQIETIVVDHDRSHPSPESLQPNHRR